MHTKRFNSLFFKAVVWLILISIVPGFIIGFHVLGVDSRILKNEILQKQQTVALRIVSAVTSSLTYQEQQLDSFVDLHTLMEGRFLFSEADLAYLRTRNPSLFYVGVLEKNGKIRAASGEPPANFAQLKPQLLQTISQKEPFVSDVFVENGRMFLWMAEPFDRQLGENFSMGTLVAALDLQELGISLVQTYPLDMQVMVVSKQGNLISYNGALEGLALTPQPDLMEQIQQIEDQLGNSSSGEVTLPSEEKILVSAARWPQQGWRVYVEQPANVVTQLLKENTLNSMWDILIILFTIFIFVVIVSYWVIMPITRPLERLRQAAVRLRDTEGVVLKESDVEIPNNEIGELARVFVEMSHALASRQKELLRAQEELAQSNQILEHRVEERTRALRETTRELVKTERLAAIGQMASIISHEIRNPLAVISNATRLIKMLVQDPDPKLVKQFGIIEAEIRQANSIISEVLGYARTRDLMLSAVNVNSYVKDIVASYPFPAAIRVQEELNDSAVRIKIDVEEIKQAIRNIIANAVEAMGGEGSLRIGTRIGRRVVCIFVADSGPGIAEDVRHKIFAPFFTTKARGTGLGLAVVSKAIARHKGKLFIRTQEGKGTCFQLYFKIYRRPGDTVYGEAS